MSDEATKHAVLLDALEAAGFPRASLVGTGNAIVWKDGAFVAIEIEGRMVLTVKEDAGATSSIRVDMNKAAARQLGAFLLAWGHAP